MVNISSVIHAEPAAASNPSMTTTTTAWKNTQDNYSTWRHTLNEKRTTSSKRCGSNFKKVILHHQRKE